MGLYSSWTDEYRRTAPAESDPAYYPRQRPLAPAYSLAYSDMSSATQRSAGAEERGSSSVRSRTPRHAPAPPSSSEHASTTRAAAASPTDWRHSW